MSRPPFRAATAAALSAAVLAAAPAPATGDQGRPPADCRVADASGDVAVVTRTSGEVVIAGGSVELLRSDDRGRSWRRDPVASRCGWPGIAEVGGRLMVSCSERRGDRRLLVIVERADAGWSDPLAVDATRELLIDTGLQPVGEREVLLLATHLDRPDDRDDAVYTIRAYRSADGGGSWSGPAVVVRGPRGLHIEDPRTILLGDGTLLLAYELEPAEGGVSTVVQRRSSDGGRSWSEPVEIWGGADVEPGGYVRFDDGGLWFVASTDQLAGGGSYDRASILVRRSSDDGRSWSAPEPAVAVEDQLSFGGAALPGGEVLLPSVRRYSDRDRRELAVYRVRRDLAGGAGCASPPISSDGFEDGPPSRWSD